MPEQPVDVQPDRAAPVTIRREARRAPIVAWHWVGWLTQRAERGRVEVAVHALGLLGARHTCEQWGEPSRDRNRDRRARREIIIHIDALRRIPAAAVERL